MTSLLQQLNNESLLLLYLADELPAEDRAEVEQMLASNSAVRAELETLRAAQTDAIEALRAGDLRERMPIPSTIAARRVGRAVDAWHARRLAAPPSDGQRRRLRFPWWTYPLASVAAVVLVIVGWWAANPDLGPKVLKAKNPMIVIVEDEDEEQQPTESSGASWEGFALVVPDESDAVLDDTEEELYAIAESRANASEILLMSEIDEQ